MEQFLKRISFFLIYLPALVYACQFARYAGYCEPLEIEIFSLSLNYPEVMLFGYLNTALLVLETLSKLIKIGGGLLIFLFLALIFVWHLKYKNEKVTFKEFIGKIEDFIKSRSSKIKNEIKDFLNSFWGLSVFYLCMLILTLGLILYQYSQGVKEVQKEVSILLASTQPPPNLGYITRNGKKTLIQPILCGNNKCYGISPYKQEAIVYLPEEYTKPIDVSKFKKAP
ncbi:hypothetical protein NRA40_11530 [Acinetobacter baumannii]|jgi:hypothetical protein|uniref:hypothetical protein n=1 Tax=Acinetobacter baumannii TaxID=470 RepID=UPI001F1D96D9|nr:hypothetical protein [Acinetobacter baumannii]MCF1333110.1 hypothetical protein [Acinetobacter baumannii]MDC4992510.1 hypothetical protein [Acinetobacter baumannii]MDC5288100.1 hypothetical protein [Acinetobacter baumannii]MDC5305518.1 hypothetical protein [Acinetobacter baumannii]MDV7600380.1 hypothetical protein [Acinetobacter baumannii]